jgi:uncharacterized Zn finger protein
MKWVKGWKVPGSNGKTWTVSIDEFGNWGCSCPDWTFRRHECKHIVAVRLSKDIEIVTDHMVEAILAIETGTLERHIKTEPTKKRRKALPRETRKVRHG